MDKRLHSANPSLYLIAGLLFGCPSEPPGASTLVPAEAGAGGDAGGGSGGGQPGSMVIDLATHPAQKTQDEIGAGEHVTLSGTVSGDCAGSLTLEAIPGAGGEGAASGPITAVTMSGAGPFSFKVPKGASFRLAGFCDANADQKVEPGVGGDGVTVQQTFGDVQEDVKNLVLELGTEMIPSAPGEAAPEAGGSPPPGGTGAAPPEGAAVGAPDAAAAAPAADGAAAAPAAADATAVPTPAATPAPTVP